MKVPMRIGQLAAVMFLVVATGAAAQSPTPQQFFESGQYEQALQQIAAHREGGVGGPAEAYLEGLVLLKLEQPDGARQAFGRLAMSGEPGWALVGESAIALLDDGKGAARDAANRAVEAAPELFPPLVKRCDSFMQWWTRASRGFASASDLLAARNAPAW